MARRMTLPHGEDSPRKRYSMPDPDAEAELFLEARRAIFPGLGDLTRPDTVTMTYEQACALLTLAEGYLDLTMYELGQECCVEKLRDIWRARRARALDGDSETGGEQ